MAIIPEVQEPERKVLSQLNNIPGSIQVQSPMDSNCHSSLLDLLLDSPVWHLQVSSRRPILLDESDLSLQSWYFNGVGYLTHGYSLHDHATPCWSQID
jgi:hypothetical protein